MYVFGGKTSSTVFSNDIYSFDLKSFQWKLLDCKNKPTPRHGHLFFLNDDYLHVYGGNDDDKDFQDFFKISVNSLDQWVPINFTGVPPSTGRPLSSCYSDPGLLFVFGGYDRSLRLESRCLKILDLKKLVWNESQCWAKLQDKNDIKQISIGSKGTEINPRYGHSINFNPDTAQLILYAGSASTYLNDMIIIDLIDD